MATAAVAVAAFVLLPTNADFPYLRTTGKVFPPEHPIIMHLEMVVERNRIMIDGQDQLIIRQQRIQHSEYTGMPFNARNLAHVELENMIFNNSHSLAFFYAGLQGRVQLLLYRGTLPYLCPGFVVL